jgi:hypothetical protein
MADSMCGLTMKTPRAGADGVQPSMSKEAACEHLVSVFGAQVASQLSETNWKSRVAGMDQALALLLSNDTQAHGIKTMLAFGHVPGWKDTNVQVFGLFKHVLWKAFVCTAAAQCLMLIFGVCLGSNDAPGIIAGVVERLADQKVKLQAFELLSSLAEVRCQVCLRFA